MKRGMVGGAYRGPVGVGRQRRTIRLMQIILVVLAAGLLVLAGYSMGQRKGYEDGRRAAGIDAPEAPAASQTVVLIVLGVAGVAAALGLQTEGGVRLLTPARLREMEESGTLPIHMEDEGPDEAVEPR